MKSHYFVFYLFQHCVHFTGSHHVNDRTGQKTSQKLLLCKTWWAMTKSGLGQWAWARRAGFEAGIESGNTWCRPVYGGSGTRVGGGPRGLEDVGARQKVCGRYSRDLGRGKASWGVDELIWDTWEAEARPGSPPD